MGDGCLVNGVDLGKWRWRHLVNLRVGRCAALDNLDLRQNAGTLDFGGCGKQSCRQFGAAGQRHPGDT